MTQEVIIIGGVGNGTVIAGAISHAAGQNGPRVAGFLNDRMPVGQRIGDHPVLGGTGDVRRFVERGYLFVYTILRIDGQDERLRLFRGLGIPDAQLLTFVHPMAYVAPGVSLGAGCVVMPNASISTGAALGRGCLVMVNASIGHDTQVGECCHLAAQSCVSSFVRMEDGVHIGLNATVREGLHLGARSTLGMGAVLLSDMNPREIWVGNPARLLRQAH